MYKFLHASAEVKPTYFLYSVITWDEWLIIICYMKQLDGDAKMIKTINGYDSYNTSCVYQSQLLKGLSPTLREHCTQSIHEGTVSQSNG